MRLLLSEITDTLNPVALRITDDYKAKYRLWAANPRVVAAPRTRQKTKFASRKFSSHAEMNEWKRTLLLN